MDVYNINNIWDYINKVDAICITTNGYVNNGIKLVMGTGIAKEARDRYRKIDYELGCLVKKSGNHVYPVRKDGLTTIVSFPTKRSHFDLNKDGLKDFPGISSYVYPKSKYYYGWQLKSEISLIRQSSDELMSLINKNNWNSVLLPMPGCNNGGLNWYDVNKEISRILDYRVFIIKKGGV